MLAMAVVTAIVLRSVAPAGEAPAVELAHPAAPTLAVEAA
jgi:hypothetical protein